MACWNKVWVLEGEPLYIQYMIKCIQEDLNNPEIAKYSTVSSADTIKSALMAFPFFETPDLIVISEPNADILKMCLQLAESDFSASGLIVTCEHNTFDSRLSFISKASKNKRVSYYEPLQGSQINKYIKDWATDSGVKIASDSYQWFEKNAPTTISKMKTQNGKKDIIVYDLMSLEKFLNKLEVLYKSEGEPISLEDLKNYSNFKRETDIWAFIDKVFAGDMTYIYQYFDSLVIDGFVNGTGKLVKVTANGLGRLQSRDRLEAESNDFHERVRQEYLQIAMMDPERYFVVDGTQSVEEINNQITARVAELPALKRNATQETKRKFRK
mgnify:CR=1 FL=1